MTFPQPQTAPALLSYKDQFRLTTPLQSPGDIYEIESSFTSLCLGPDSDLAALLVTYYNSEIATTQLSNFRLTPQNPFAAKISPNLGQSYPTSVAGGRLGRTLVSTIDVYDPNYRPLSFNVANDKMQFQVPVLDVIGWFGTPPTSLPIKRADKYYYTQYQPFAAGISWVAYPYYGRKYAFLDIVNRNAATGATVTMLGVNLSTTDTGSGGVSYHQEKTIINGQAVAAAGGHLTCIVTASSFGMFDLLVVGISGGNPTSFRLYMSDEPISGYTATPTVVTP